MLLHYLGKLEIQIFSKYLADTEENVNKLHFSSSINLFAVYLFQALQIQTSHQNLVLVAEYYADCWYTLLWRISIAKKLIAKVNKWKNTDIENFICNQYGERLAILNTENIKVCRWITKLETIKNAMCLQFSTTAEYVQKIWIFDFPR